MKKSLLEPQKRNFTILIRRHSSDSDSGEDYAVSDNENDNVVVANPVVVAVAPIIVAQQAYPPGPPANPFLRPNGHQWRVDGEFL